MPIHDRQLSLFSILRSIAQEHELKRVLRGSAVRKQAQAIYAKVRIAPSLG